MLRDIIKKEIIEVITSLKFLFTFLLCAVLILLSVLTGIATYRAEQKEYTTALALNKNNMESQASYLSLAGQGVKINKVPQVLSTINSGISEAVGRVATVSNFGDPTLVESKNESKPIFSVYGTLDLTFIVKIVLSLFAILFTYDSIVGEKERGTLKLTLSYKVPRDRLILGKIIGGYIGLLIPLIIPLILGMLILLIYPNINMSGQDWGRLLLTFLIYFLYLSVFFALGLLVSARTQKSSTSFLVLLFIWVVFVTIIPKISVLLASQVRPVPSIHEITAKKNAFHQQVFVGAQKRAMDWMRENAPKTVLDQKAYQDKFRKFQEEFLREMTSKTDEYNAALERDYQARMRSQERLAINFSRISPASALTFSTMSLARTGLDEYNQFLASIRAYKLIFTKWMSSRMLLSGEQGKVNLADMPQYSYEPEPLGKSLARTIPDFGLMLFLIIVFFAGAYVSFLKYDVR
jgi:ABC-type transport system involved in multi-copper enzyme maturation permease subunit